jgi:hypothetical protein
MDNVQNCDSYTNITSSQTCVSHWCLYLHKTDQISLHGLQRSVASQFMPDTDSSFCTVPWGRNSVAWFRERTIPTERHTFRPHSSVKQKRRPHDLKWTLYQRRTYICVLSLETLTWGPCEFLTHRPLFHYHKVTALYLQHIPTFWHKWEI